MQAMMARGALGVMNLAMARFMDVYQRLFESAGAALAQDALCAQACCRWLIPSETREAIYTDGETRTAAG